MDKSRFVEVSPFYYALAIITHMQRNWGGPVSRSSLVRAFTHASETGDPEEYYCLLEKELLLDKAISWLVEQEMIAVIPDEFGPPIYQQTASFDPHWAELKRDERLPFGRYALSPDGEDWVRAALVSVNREFDKHLIMLGDFDQQRSEWEPIPLDRVDPQLNAAIDAIDEAIEMVRSDNGYSATLPEERTFVLDSLANASQTLKEANSTSWPYVRTYALEPLGRLIRRFGAAAIGIAATVARDSLLTWLKAAGVKIIDWVFKSLT